VDSRIGRKLKMVSKVAGWIEGNEDIKTDLSPISIQTRKAWICQVPEARSGVLVDQRHEERHAHQRVMSEWWRARRY
jgi:hypothetical protein